jgi:hypothetical protein
MNPLTTRFARARAGLATTLLLAGCQTAYYKTMETFGYHKRDLLVERVKDARDDQQEVKEQFQSALEKFSAVTKFQGGKLEEKYRQLQREYDRSEEKARAVGKRLGEVEDVAAALFKEWERELGQYTSPALRQASERQLDQTRRHYDQLIGAMKRAEQRIQPVLLAFRDQVLFLKHNLNAQAIASLGGTATTIQTDISSLIADMNKSIAEADAFVKSLQGT